MNNKKTAVEWLVEQLHIAIVPKEELIEQAKQLEKQQIIDAWYDGIHNWDNVKSAQEYYTETYGGQDNG
jgi:hypothetical protein